VYTRPAGRVPPKCQVMNDPVDPDSMCAALLPEGETRARSRVGESRHSEREAPPAPPFGFDRREGLDYRKPSSSAVRRLGGLRSCTHACYTTIQPRTGYT
jgi:hypothetical protein